MLERFATYAEGCLQAPCPFSIYSAIRRSEAVLGELS